MNILYISLLISLATLGIRAITGKEMIFYFLRKPFDNLSERLTRRNSLIDEMSSLQKRINSQKQFKLKDYNDIEKRITEVLIEIDFIDRHHNLKRHETILYIMKPIIICSTCMASVHTLVWWYVIGFEWDYRVILVMLIVAILNTIGWLMVEVLQSNLKRAKGMEYKDGFKRMIKFEE